jgi:hypothetical protein
MQQAPERRRMEFSGSILWQRFSGRLSLFSITMRNSIMMISPFEHLLLKEGEIWGLHAAVRGASERLTPVLMTATVTALRLLRSRSEAGKPDGKSKANGDRDTGWACHVNRIEPGRASYSRVSLRQVR